MILRTKTAFEGVLRHVQDRKIQPRTGVDALGRDVRLKHVSAALAPAAHQLVLPFFVVPRYEVLVYCHDGSFWKPSCGLDGGNLPGYDRVDASVHEINFCVPCALPEPFCRRHVEVLCRRCHTGLPGSRYDLGQIGVSRHRLYHHLVEYFVIVDGVAPVREADARHAAQHGHVDT